MNNTQKLEFNKKINIDFSWWEITWNAWLLCFHEFCTKLWVEKLLKKYLPEIRWDGYTHTKSEIIYQKLIRIASWNTSNNNYGHLKVDPVFQEIHNNKIASSSSCSRLENTFNYSDVANLRKIQEEIEGYNLKETKPKEVIIDLDTTNDPASNNLEWCKFIPHYWLDWFAPLLAFGGLNWDVLGWILKPWNYHCSTLSVNFVERLIKRYKKEGIKKTILRWDSAFSIPKLYELCEEENTEYYLKMSSNSALIKEVEWKWKMWISTFEEFEYQAGSWDKSRRIIACIDWKPRETEESKKKRSKKWKRKLMKQCELFPVYSFIVTNNLELSKEEVFSMYNWRATIEKSIEEAKNWFEIDHLSNDDFRVNSANFQIHLLAIQLVQLFRKFTMTKDSKQKSKEMNNIGFQDSKKITKKFKKKKIWRKEIALPSITTIRKQIFNIPSKLVKTWRQIYYKSATSFKFQDLFMKVLRKVQKLKPLMI